ncbi:MAG TPA: hypothetical protein VFA33_30175 [Bryobacteraceae bacterium]|nr:hypothetical protein [Bryobacteraceae bacterium]
MADESGVPAGAARSAENGAQAPARSKDEIALELMKFIAVTTGYGKGTTPGAGFSGKPSPRSAEEYADALLELFERCRGVVNRPTAQK